MKIFFIILLTTVAIGGWQQAEKVHKLETVYAVCNESRISPTITETECGQLQDKWGIEFLCQANNTDPQNHCWTEQK